MSAPSARPIRVAVVEDDDALRDSLEALLSRHGGFACVGAFPDAASALAALPGLAPEVVLMDIHLPDRSGIECVAELRSRCPSTQAVMLTTFDDDDLVFSALEAGAKGYLLKRAAPEEILEAIADVHRGGSPMTSSIARKVVQAFHRPPRGQPPTESLTPRETELLEHLVRGLAYKQVADRMGISIDTVRSHIRKVYEKLQVHSRTEAVMKFIGHDSRQG
jgi:DNA-binding NarL/FixJ family response regulator